MAILNFMFPTFIFVFKGTNNGLNKCLGKSYLTFLSSENKVCPDNEIFCWVCFTLYLVTASNIIDIYCTICCLRDVEKWTEKSKKMLSRQNYSNRKRYDLFVVKILTIINSFIFFRDNGITIEITLYQLYTETVITVLTIFILTGMNYWL